MPFPEIINQHYGARLLFPNSPVDIPRDTYMVYILGVGDDVVSVGHGKRNRAKVIFDSLAYSTPSHIKALKIRLYNLFRNEDISRYRAIIPCDSREEAKRTETHLHNMIGGNSVSIPEDIRNLLFQRVGQQNHALIFIRLALCSYYDGLSDLRRWRAADLIDQDTWNVITNTLNI